MSPLPPEQRQPYEDAYLRRHKERQLLLDEHPELRREVDIEALKILVPMVDFRCNAYSSVARGQAIEGSDVDDGVVITEDRVDAERQLAFVQELRKQGFSVHTQKEIDDLRKQIEEAQKSDPSKIDDLARRKNHAEASLVEFHTVSDIRRMLDAKEEMTDAVRKTRAGHSILHNKHGEQYVNLFTNL